MEIKQSGSQPSGKEPAERLTGTACIDPLFSPPDPARVADASIEARLQATRAYEELSRSTDGSF